MDAGVVLMPFGSKARRQAAQVVASLRASGNEYPVLCVGDGKVAGADYLPWEGADPFDRQGLRNFRFLAGRVKPHLHALVPWERTLYLDSDVRVLAKLAPAFSLLQRWELLVALHPDPHGLSASQNVAALYNKRLAAWQHNLEERDATMAGWAGDGDVPFWNSGVLFWRRCPAVATLMAAWATEWERWQQWDEQLALMRAAYAHPLHVLVLPVSWNAPHRHQAKAIFHWYGRGTVRENPA